MAHINPKPDFSGSPTLLVWRKTREGLELRLDAPDRESESGHADVPQPSLQAVAARTSRRIRLGAATAALAVIFALAGLAGVFSETWQYFGAAVLVLSFIGLVDQLLDRRGS